MDVLIKCTIEKLAFPVDGYWYNVKEWRSVDGGKEFYYCGHGRYCKTLHEAEEYATAIDGEERTQKRLFQWYKRRLLAESGPAIRFVCVQYLCHFPDIDPVKMAAALEEEGATIIFDNSSISSGENRRLARAVQQERRLLHEKF